MDKQWLVGLGACAALILAAVAASYFGGFIKPAPAVPQQDDAYPVPQEIEVVRTVDAQGVHTFSGSVPMTSTCNVVSSGISTDEAGGELRVSLALRILAATSRCEGVADGATQTFYASFDPRSDKPVTLSALTINGEPVEFVER